MSLLSLVEDVDISSSHKKAVKELLAIDNTISNLSHIQAILSWDREVMMPQKGIHNRGEQMSTLESLIHEWTVHPKVAELLHILEVTEENPLGSSLLPQKIQLWLRAKYRQWYIASCIPPALLQEIVKTQVASHAVWVQARKENNFSLFAPYLEKTLTLQREKADCIGYTTSRYDALLQEYEPDITTDHLTPLFTTLQQTLSPLYQYAQEHGNTSGNFPSIPCAQQQQFCQALATTLGFEGSIGRIDTSPHPFSTQLGPQDARITIALFEDNPMSSVFSTLHELGHSFYELNVDPIYYNTVCANGTSFGIHESQSRFLECVIGKSRAFWEHYYPSLQQTMTAFSQWSLDEFMTSIHRVHASPIRIEADELSYNLHIVVRFELEKALIENTLAVADLPDAWNEKYATYLQVNPQNDSEGVLQDVHWSEGFFGYFPSYTLGNIYAGTLHTQLVQDIQDYESHIKAGNIAHIFSWLKTTIHQHGAAKRPNELLQLSTDPFIEYLTKRYRA